MRDIWRECWIFFIHQPIVNKIVLASRQKTPLNCQIITKLMVKRNLRFNLLRKKRISSCHPRRIEKRIGLREQKLL